MLQRSSECRWLQTTLAEAGAHLLMGAVQSRGYRFYHYHPDTNEMIWYKWCTALPDLVPAYATSIEGGAVLVLSPDRSQVLLVWERGRLYLQLPCIIYTCCYRWGCPGGAVDMGESCLEGAIRECKEEVDQLPTIPGLIAVPQVGLEIDVVNFAPLLAAAYNQPGEHYACIWWSQRATDC